MCPRNKIESYQSELLYKSVNEALKSWIQSCYSATKHKGYFLTMLKQNQTSTKTIKRPNIPP